MTQRTRTGLLAFALIGVPCLIVAIVGAIYLFSKDGGGLKVPKIGGPSEEKEGQKWSMEELVAYLKANGMKNAELRKRGWSEKTYITFETGMADKELDEHRYDLRGAVEIQTEQYPDPKMSRKDNATHMNLASPGVALAWGRFVLVGDPVSIAKIKAILS